MNSISRLRLAPCYLVAPVMGLPEVPLGALPPTGRFPNGVLTPCLMMKIIVDDQPTELPLGHSCPLVPVVEDGVLVHGLEVGVGHLPDPEHSMSKTC